MDAGGRRGPRMVIDPKVRQVGFVTPGSEQEAAATNSVEMADSPAPVMIPPAPTRVVDPSPPNLAKPVPIPTRSPPFPPRKVDNEEEMPLGSYNPSDSLLGGSPNSSFGKGSNEKIDAGDLSPDTVNHLNSSLMEMSIKSDNFQLPPAEKSDITVKFKREPVAHDSGNAPPTDKGGNAQSKKLKERTSRAERRALQESQRAAKAATKASGEDKPTPQKKEEKKQDTKKTPEKSEKERKKESPGEKQEKRKDVPAPRMQFDDEQRVAKAKRRAIVGQTETKHRVELFRHLPQFVHAAQLRALEEKFFQDDTVHIHRSVYQVGLKFLTWEIVGGNARCIAMLTAFIDMIRDYTTPPEKTLSRDLTARINSQVSFLTTCRPLSISMGNAIRSLKLRIGKVPVTLTESEAKSNLVTQLDNFIQEKIILADKEIVKHAITKIRDGDVVLTHGHSCVVEMILLEAFRAKVKFRVVVVDSRPRLEGKKLLKRLLAEGVECTYTHMNAISYIMQEVTRVFMGAASILSNGTVYSRVGTAAVAMVAHSYRVPVMICCETYKFHERVQLDSICSNELGDPDALVKVDNRKDCNELVGWTENERLQLLNLLYDATPADYVSMIITELGMVPPTSVPVILREYRKEPTL